MKTKKGELPELDLFFKRDIVDLKKHPDRTIREKMKTRKNTIYDFSRLGMPAKAELKHYLKHIIYKNIKYQSMSEYLTSLYYLIGFFEIMSGSYKSTSLKIYSEEIEEEFKEYLERNKVVAMHHTLGKRPTLLIYKRASVFRK